MFATSQYSSITAFLFQNIGVASYPVYHSVYETFNYVSTHIDPEFVIHRAMAQIWGEMARRLADSVILPIDCRLYAKFLEKNRNSLYEGYGEEMTREGIDFSRFLQFWRTVVHSFFYTYTPNTSRLSNRNNIEHLVWILLRRFDTGQSQLQVDCSAPKRKVIFSRTQLATTVY